MMLYPAMNELLEEIPSRYKLVNVVAARARQIATEAETEKIMLEDKPVSMAIREVAEGKLSDEYWENCYKKTAQPEAEDVVLNTEEAPSAEEVEIVADTVDVELAEALEGAENPEPLAENPELLAEAPEETDAAEEPAED